MDIIIINWEWLISQHQFLLHKESIDGAGALKKQQSSQHLGDLSPGQRRPISTAHFIKEKIMVLLQNDQSN